jgi:hypothetical protein
MKIDAVLRAAAWALALLGAALFALNAADLVRRDVPGDYVEGLVLATQTDVANGHSAFDKSGLAAPPFRVNAYGPVFYWLGASGVRASAHPGSLAPGRLLSLAALAVCLAALWGIGRRVLALPKGAVLFGLLVPLGLVPVLVFVPQNRVDTLAVAFSLLGLLAAAAGSAAGCALAGAFFVLGVFTKPTALAAPVAAFLWLVLSRRFRAAGALAAACLVLGGAWLWRLNGMTDGGFALAVFGSNAAAPFALGGFVKAAQAGLAGAVLPVLMGLGVAVVARGGSAERLVAAWALLSFILALATVGKVGANVNYFIEPALACAPLAALAWARASRETAALGVGTAALAASLLHAAPRVALERRGRAERAILEPRLTGLLRGKTVVTMEVVSVLRAGGTPYLNDPHAFARMAEAGKWDERRLVADVRSGAIDVVLADADLAAVDPAFSNWSRAVRAAVVESDGAEGTVGPNLYLYRPRGARP